MTNLPPAEAPTVERSPSAHSLQEQPYPQTQHNITQTLIIKPGCNWVSFYPKIEQDFLEKLIVKNSNNLSKDCYIIFNYQNYGEEKSVKVHEYNFKDKAWSLGKLSTSIEWKNMCCYHLLNKCNESVEVEYTSTKIDDIQTIKVDYKDNWIGFHYSEPTTIEKAIPKPPNGLIIKTIGNSNSNNSINISESNNRKWYPKNFEIIPGEGYCLYSPIDQDLNLGNTL